MSIKDVQVAGRQQIEGVKRQLDRETRRLENDHQIRKSEIRKSQAEEIVDLRNDHANTINQETDKREKVLNEMSANLDKTKKLTAHQVEQLRSTTERVTDQERQRLAKNRQDLASNHLLHQEDMMNRFSEKTKDLHEEGNYRVEVIKNKNESKIQEKEEQFREKLGNQNEKHLSRIKQDEVKFTQIKNQQDAQFKNERLAANQGQQIQISKLTEHHNKIIKDRDVGFRKGVKEQDLMFEEKYAKTLKQHNDNLTRLNSKSDEVISKIKSGVDKNINASAKRSNDPFYNFTELRPVVSYQENGIIVKVAVPEHSKQDLQLSLNGKEVILSYSRRHDDSRKTEDTLSKIQKIESMSSRVKTDYILNPKAIKSNYENGVMTYTIAKA